MVDPREYSSLPESKWLTIKDELTEQGVRSVEAVAQRGIEQETEAVTTVTRGIPHEEILT